MPDYWVSYNILSSRDGSPLGTGTCRTTMAGPPRNAIEVDRLSDSIMHDVPLPEGQFVAVTSWSRMGD